MVLSRIFVINSAAWENAGKEVAASLREGGGWGCVRGRHDIIRVFGFVFPSGVLFFVVLVHELCDILNPLCGKQGPSALYNPPCLAVQRAWDTPRVLSLATRCMSWKAPLGRAKRR
ncbi:unnamed protein product, partial [Sphacelaria rigidula]